MSNSVRRVTTSRRWSMNTGPARGRKGQQHRPPSTIASMLTENEVLQAGVCFEQVIEHDLSSASRLSSNTDADAVRSDSSRIVADASSFLSRTMSARRLDPPRLVHHERQLAHDDSPGDPCEPPRRGRPPRTTTRAAAGPVRRQDADPALDFTPPVGKSGPGMTLISSSSGSRGSAIRREARRR